MMKLILTALLLTSALCPAPIVSIDSPDITGAPGANTSWRAKVYSDPLEYITFTSSFLLFESNAALGAWSDAIGWQGGPVNFYLPPAVGLWETVVGSYFIDGSAMSGDENAATLRLQFEAYSGDPFTCGACFLYADSIDLPVRVTVTEAPAGTVPEPATLWMPVAAFGLLAAVRAATTTRFSCLMRSKPWNPGRLHDDHS